MRTVDDLINDLRADNARLRAQVEGLREALRPIAEAGARYVDDPRIDTPRTQLWARVDARLLRAAHAALAATEPTR